MHESWFGSWLVNGGACAAVGTRALIAGQYYILFTLDVYALS